MNIQRLAPRYMPLYSAILVFAAGCASIDDLAHKDGHEPVVIPTLRFAVYESQPARYEDVSEGHPAMARYLASFDRAPTGPMQVNCDGIEEVGVMIREERRTGYGHKFGFALVESDSGGPLPDHFIYTKRRLINRKLAQRGAARFRGSPQSGVIKIVVTHRDDVVFSTEFELIGCN